MRPPQSLTTIRPLTLLWAVLVATTSARGQDEPPEFAATQPTETQPAVSLPAPQAERGQLEDIELLDLEVPTVVTATRHAQKITTVPHAVSVITAEDIRWSGARSIPDALRLVPGVDVAELGFGNAAVSPRGLHGLLGREVLVLVDGRQLFDAVFGGTLWGSWPFQLEDIERIEVIRGPGGVTWGANAVNGVINIITKDPADQVGLTFTGGGGSRGTHKEHLAYGFADDKLRLRISGEHEASDGFRRGGSLLRGLNDDYMAGRMGLHAVYDAGPDDTLTFSAGSSIVDGGLSPPPMAAFRTLSSGSQANFVLGKWTHTVAADNHFDVTAYVNDFHLSAGVPAIDYRYQQFALQFGHTFKPAAGHTLTWGIDTRADIAECTNADPFLFAKHSIGTGIVGLYVQDEWRLAPKWVLNLGGRLDYEFYGGLQPSARAALSYELMEDALLYGAVSRAFQMPPSASRFLRMPMLGGLAYLTADQEVEAEALLAYELGYRGRFFDRVGLSLNLFWHEYDSLSILGLRPGPPGLFRLHFDNGYAAAIYGVELDTQYTVSAQLKLLGNYTYQIMDGRGPASIFETDYCTPPKHKFMLGARYSPVDDLHLGAHLYYVDAITAPNPSNPLQRRHVSPYFRLDLRAEYEFWQDRASVAVGVRNLLDSHHYEAGSLFVNDAEVPRTVYAELRLRFK